MPYQANKATYKEQPASWDPSVKQYQLYEDGQPAGIVSTKAQAKKFVSTSNKEDRHMRRTLQGKKSRIYS